MHTLIFVRQNIFTCFIKSINSEINNKSPGTDGLTTKFYKHFSLFNVLAPVLLDVLTHSMHWGINFFENHPPLSCQAPP